MSKKKKRNRKVDLSKKQENHEDGLSLEEVKSMSLAEVERTHKDQQVGISEEDDALDRYIKHHRKDIEAGQKAVQERTVPFVDTKESELPRETSTADNVSQGGAEVLEKETSDSPDVGDVDVVETQEVPILLHVSDDTDIKKTNQVAAESLGDTAVFDRYHADELDSKAASDQQPPSKKLGQEGNDSKAISEKKKGQPYRKRKSPLKRLLIGIAALALVSLIAVISAILPTSSSKKTNSSSGNTGSGASVLTRTRVKDFNDLYDKFFVDKTEEKLKNDQFDQLPKLKEALDKIDTSSNGYSSCRDKYNQLSEAIESVTAVNNLFDKPVLVNGDIVTDAHVKADVTPTYKETSFKKLNTQLASVVEKAKTQLANKQQGTNATTNSNNPSRNPSSVTPHRSSSRVPYNQSAVNDANNSAWEFAPGVLDNILAIARQRGYITGDNYILERVNIINGNGYYNLYRPDGTYLFSINCKTGYFVGNGKGYSDALDY